MYKKKVHRHRKGIPSFSKFDCELQLKSVFYYVETKAQIYLCYTYAAVTWLHEELEWVGKNAYVWFNKQKNISWSAPREISARILPAYQ